MFKREKYLKQLIDKKNNHLIKVITGLRRCGKSFLLNNIFYNYLINEEKVSKNHIIRFAFDVEEDISLLDAYLPDELTVFENKQKTINSKKFLLFIKDQLKDNETYYLLLDEIQNLDNFVRTLNSFLRNDNIDIYVTGSNSYMLSSNIDTEFGGRTSQIHLLPLSFSEYLNDCNIEKKEAFEIYERYGGLPLVENQKNDLEKMSQAISIYKDTYLSDIIKRHPQVNENSLDETLHVVASMISTLLNPTKIEKTLKSKYRISFSNDIISNYIKWFEDAFLLKKALRYDVKGRSYIGTPYKVYFEDIGIRNAILNFRDIDETDLIENIVFNELRYRGYTVDVGIVPSREKTNKKDASNKYIYKKIDREVDFIANRGDKKYYIQVALDISSSEKKDQEYESLRNISDSFKKIIIVKNQGLPYYTDEGFLRISLMDFLTNDNSLDY